MNKTISEEELKSVDELKDKMGSAYKDLSVQVAYKEGYNRAIKDKAGQQQALDWVQEQKIGEKIVIELNPDDLLTTQKKFAEFLIGQLLKQHND